MKSLLLRPLVPRATAFVLLAVIPSLLASVVTRGADVPPAAGAPATAPTAVEVKSATLDGKLEGDTARLVLQATLGGLLGDREPALVGVRLRHVVGVTPRTLTHAIEVRADAVRGGLREIVLPLRGEGEVRSVTGEGLEDWSLRQSTGAVRQLVLRLRTGAQPVKEFTGRIAAETQLGALPSKVQALAVQPEPAALGGGYVRIDIPAELEVSLTNATGLVPVPVDALPAEVRPPTQGTGTHTLAFRFHGEPFSLPLQVALADPEAREVVLSGFSLTGDLSDTRAAFTLTGVARVRNPAGGVLDLLSGGVALARPPAGAGWRMEYRQGRFRAVFDRAGEYPVRVEFEASVRSEDTGSSVDFQVAAGALAPVTVRGLAADTRLTLADAARPERRGEAFVSFLPAGGKVRLNWRQTRPESEGRLFYAAEAVSQIAVSPGLLRQTSLLDLRVMQGELSRLELRLAGDGEVTRVQGPQVLSWEVRAGTTPGERRLLVQFNQPQRDAASVQLQIQRSLGAFPLAFDAVQVLPEGATRFGGHVRIVNEGAVRLEVVESAGLSQISPEQFVQSEATKALLPAQATQIFAYRFAGNEHRLRIQADNILPELGVSAVLVHRLGETELAIDGELEIDVREAPLRELLLRVPKGYSLARLAASGLSDHFLTEPEGAPDALLRLVYGTPAIGRQVVQLRLERNQALAGTRWALPRIEVQRAKSVRGHVGVSADAGLRLTAEQTPGLTELPPAFFPRKTPGLQAAYRLSDPAWQATFAVERLAQSVQADALHLFSVGEGIAYGSSLLQYVVSGAPISTLRVELSSEYFNVEFTGKNIRNWQKTDAGYQVQLHTPVSGSYALLATYERPFKAQGETLAFTGARPVDAQTEQGYTVIVSAYQFQVQPANVSESLAAVEPAEVPAEYRLFFDAPILAAYRYSARPFQLQMELRPLAQGATVNQVIDRAALVTRISDEGQVVTEARYFVKNKGTPNLRLRLPEGAELWSVTLDGATVVPVKDAEGSLIPLPTRADPDVVSELRVKVASKAGHPRRITVAAPVVSAPVLLAEWRIEPASGKRLVYRGGSLTPAEGETDDSGFAGLRRLADSEHWEGFLGALLAMGAGLFLASFVLRRAGGGGMRRFGVAHLAFGVVGVIALLIAIAGASEAYRLAKWPSVDLVANLRFLAPVQQADAAWQVALDNLPLQAARFGFVSWLFAGMAVLVWLWAAVIGSGWLGRFQLAGAWTLLGWAALRSVNGASAFIGVLAVFAIVQVVLPSVWRWWQAPSALVPPTGGTPAGAAATAAVVVAIGVTLCGVTGLRANAQPAAEPAAPGKVNPAAKVAASSPAVPPVVSGVELVEHDVRVEDEFALGTAQIRWRARRGDALPLFREPGILTRSGHDTNQARLVAVTREGRRQHLLVAEADGVLAFPLEYQVRVSAREGQRGFVLPVTGGLVHRARVRLTGLEVDVVSPQAVSVRPDPAGPATNTVADLVLAPSTETWIGWRPRSRDTRREKAVFYSEINLLLVPGPGVVEGLHDVRVRPAQGEVRELEFVVPAGATVTDVASPVLSQWRFDPDTRRLRVGLAPAQSKPFAVTVTAQWSATPLPFERSAGLLVLEGAAGQIGLAGVATGPEVQLDDVKADGFSAINLEDFPGEVVQPLAARVPGLTLRRAYRYTSMTGSLTVKAAAVESDVRVDSQQTLSLGEDRTVLAATLGVEVLRAGIFRFSFALPAGLEVESVTGGALSHWTELKTGDARVVTLHLKGKTEGRQQFALTLAGPGVRTTNGWTVPRLSVREAAKQRGQLTVVPETGLRLQVTQREGATQLDPLQSGIRQKGALAFRLLQDPWVLRLDLERVDAWIQVTGLQHATVTEAQVKVSANLQYEIENTGVKALVLRLPAGAENVRFRGEQLADFLVRPGAANAATRDWEVKLERRLLGKYLLHASYTLPLAEKASEFGLDGIQALDVNLQRGFVAVQAQGRLQVRIDAPTGVQGTEWQTVPRALLQDLGANAASYTYRLVEPAFRLPVKLERRDATRLLPARVNGVAFTSVISDDGAMLTQARVTLVPGDKRLLHLTLPEGARFWFAFVNQNSVWPWQSTNQILLPLEQNTKAGEPTVVEFFYSASAGRAAVRSLDLKLVAPKFDLPLEDIVWNVYLNEKWQVSDWAGSLQLRETGPASGGPMLDLDSYVLNEQQIRLAKTREAEQFLNLANSLVQQGDPTQARRAFRAAYGLSQHDQAFNEDARVQLNNLKVQQALVGLNVRQARVAGESAGQAASPKAVWDNSAANYSQGEAKQLLERNSAEETAVQQRLAERLVQQQDAAMASPAAIRAAIPQQGRRLVFTRPLEVNTWADLSLDLQARAAGRATGLNRLLVLVGLFVGFVAVSLAAWRPRD